MAARSFEALLQCGEFLVLKSLAFTCQLTRAHAGEHHCRANDQGTQVEWPVVWQARLKQVITQRRTLPVN